jgi:hypothetical protein
MARKPTLPGWAGRPATDGAKRVPRAVQVPRPSSVRWTPLPCEFQQVFAFPATQTNVGEAKKSAL